ncbi:MAG: hypothetical protein J6T52_12790, partial [Bacteroidaceae bacterium]|nr:hypothetical protein [Bacteroidaceae bacterium]
EELSHILVLALQTSLYYAPIAFASANIVTNLSMNGGFHVMKKEWGTVHLNVNRSPLTIVELKVLNWLRRTKDS